MFEEKAEQTREKLQTVFYYYGLARVRWIQGALIWLASNTNLLHMTISLPLMKRHQHFQLSK